MSLLKQMKAKRNHEADSDDPMAGMTNLFDLALVFALALMVALVSFFKMPELLQAKDFTIIKNAGKKNMEILVKKGKKIEKYTPRKNKKKSGSGGSGKKIGTAYELENGEVIYIPE